MYVRFVVVCLSESMCLCLETRFVIVPIPHCTHAYDNKLQLKFQVDGSFINSAFEKNVTH